MTTATTHRVLAVIVLVISVAAYLSFWRRQSAAPVKIDVNRLVSLLNDRGKEVHLVPTMKNGPITGSCWLTSNASDDWDSIQLKINYHLINGWERSGMVSIYSKTDPRPAVEETVYGKEYYEVADYFFIGDPELIDHIKEIVQ